MATLRAVIPTLRVTDVEASLPLYRALGFEIAWQHQLGEDAPRLTAVARDSGQLFLTEHPVAPRFARIAELRHRLSEAEGAPTALPKKESGDG